ncbi:hypothetical protein AB0A84_25190 [Streptomyces albidoflavus]|uniref:hypothetical protein n=1 Tax=Streptomyces albidoflavus TaxID=1886 RepID=UPI00099BBEBE
MDGFLSRVGVVGRPVQEGHEIADVVDRPFRGGQVDRLVGTFDRLRRPGEQGDQVGDVVHGPFHGGGAQDLLRGFHPARRLLQQPDQVDDLRHRPRRDRCSDQAVDGVGGGLALRRLEGGDGVLFRLCAGRSGAGGVFRRGVRRRRFRRAGRELLGRYAGREVFRFRRHVCLPFRAPSQFGAAAQASADYQPS